MRAIEAYLRPDVVREIVRLDLKAKFIVEGFISGLHDSPYRGFSGEFSEHQKYNIGDDLKDVDWNVFARTDKFYVKRFEAETNLYCYLLVDVSESMAYRFASAVTKLEYSTYLAAALGYLMINQQDAVGLLTFDRDIVNRVSPRSRRTHLASLLGALSSSARHEPSRLAACLHRAAGLMPKRGLAIVLSDLIPAEDETQDQVLEALRHLKYRGHDVICFQVLDRAEVEFPFEGSLRFIDVESLRQVKANADAIREDYRREIGRFVEFYRTGCQQVGADFVQVNTSIPFDEVLLAYLRARRSHF